ncbi:MAG: hypothetical protein K6C97_06355 [Treponema sp.]|nr:hypothetical protein [Treponema sp.]
MKKNIIFTFILLINTLLFADPFNQKLTDEERGLLSSGQVLIKNINYERNISLKEDYSSLSDELLNVIDDLNPKYLAEIIQIRPYKGNENFDEMLQDFLYNVQDYAGIPYFSERGQTWYDLYEWAKITESVKEDNVTTLKAQMKMDPFDIVEETIQIKTSDDVVLYIAQNENKLRYLDKFDCIWPQKMKICILLFRDGENWIFYGIGGVNAPRIPFFTERIQTSFINRINTFCSYIFKKFE